MGRVIHLICMCSKIKIKRTSLSSQKWCMQVRSWSYVWPDNGRYQAYHPKGPKCYWIKHINFESIIRVEHTNLKHKPKYCRTNIRRAFLVGRPSSNLCLSKLSKFFKIGRGCKKCDFFIDLLIIAFLNILPN
jgi:hypothetical protein